MNSIGIDGSNVLRPQQQIQGVEADEDEEEGDMQAEVVEEDKGAARTRIKRMLNPKLPSQAEVDFHMLTHLPYRNWCEHCVKGRAKEMNHGKSKDKHENIEFHGFLFSR